MSIENLWGDLSDLETVQTPKAILQQQAALLTSATRGECDRTCGGHAMRGVGLRNCCWNSSQALEAFRHLRLSIA